MTKEKVKINIATPCYGGKITTTYLNSLIKLIKSWNDLGIDYSFTEFNYPEIELSRNLLLSHFYFNKPQYTHILFIDDDMGFESSMINRMIQLNEDVVGAVSPKRYIDLKKLHSASDIPYDKALAQSAQFVSQPKDISAAKNGFLTVNYCGAGIFLISRKCITRMIKCCPDATDKVYHKNLPITADFEMFLTPFNRIKTETRSLSEDYSFCHRWVNQCSGKIYVNIDSRIKHVATQIVESKLTDYFS